MMSPNGKILIDIIERHALIVANGTDKCSGLITRQRSTSKRTEQSCIDLLMFSSDLQNSFESLLIDEARIYVLTRITNTKKGAVKKESDHNALIAEFNLNVNMPESVKKSEVYNLKNSECQKKFFKYTSDTKMLSSVFNSKDDLNILANRFIKKLDGCIKKSFRKVRVNKHKESEEEKLYKKMRVLKELNDEDSKDAINEVVKDIANIAEAKYKQVIEELSKMKPEEGRIDSQKFWKIKKETLPSEQRSTISNDR